MGIKHWLAHKLGWNLGKVETFWSSGRLMVCFRCSGCNRVSDVHATTVRAAMKGGE